MIDSFLNLICVAILVVISIVAIKSIEKRDPRQGGCDYNCDMCPFPKCSEEQIARWKEYDLHNR